jgi:opacity protein-like surface antigen
MVAADYKDGRQMKRIMVLAAVLMTCGHATRTARAADEPTPFEKGTWNVALAASYLPPIRFSEDELYNLNISAGYYFWNNNSLNVELQGYWGDQDFDADVYIGGIGLLGRWHFYNGRRWSLFLDGGGSVVYADQEFPRGGTNFNLTGKVGAGATFEISDNTHLMGGVRYFHLSNGQIRKSDDNPSYDSIQFWGGVMWTW